MNKPPPLKVLAVDSSPGGPRELQDMLADAGADVLVALTGDQALDLLQEHDVALALLDVRKSVLVDAYALAEAMRGDERTRHVPIIFITGADAAAHPSDFRGLEAGAVDVLSRPLDRRVLHGKVRVFLDLQQQRLLLAERVAAQARLQRLNATMLSALLHDIRSPLAALALNAELLVRRHDPVGARMKSAAAMLARQLEHLVNLAQLPSDEITPQLTEGRFDELVRRRLDAPVNLALVHRPFEFALEGDPQAQFDAALLADAIDHLLLQAVTHAGDEVVRVTVDGHSRRAVVLRIAFDAVLGAAAAQHMFGGGGVPVQGAATPRSGPGLLLPECIVRAHGGSLIGRTKEGEGTLFEMMLPRGPLP